MEKIIRKTIFNLLAKRDYTQHDLTQKLKAKNHPLDDIAIVVTEMTEAGYINDLRYAENFLRSRRLKGYGPDRIASELKAHGIAPHVIADLLKIPDNAWFTEVRRVWEKRFKNKHPTNMQDRAKQMRYLQYRGFTREQIESVYDNQE